ncbi:hypothetical protein ONB71_00085 [Candidatus Purcelliella pentastirinorum]|uniref:D-3-phosphoglycerate dehydrogenase n=1 Tax=Candidatus Purcelliella pentastirinorum TaxID=472834 RepID=A0AAX3NAR1_9ENTR|nr:hypothetical protein [Candidatus Purcelliella pentastirinorum]WDI78545.1 hypothetical protein ONB71_00085 [Candidatus Purcelliella pentastirinorum]WDR80426.1 hypothetical protein ONB70_01835 [Candidatus Purcelliella pentastirinorum]
MKIIIDENIPYTKELFNNNSKIKKITGRKINNYILKNINAIIIRSTTKINKKILNERNIKFIRSTTSGIYHINKKIIKKKKLNSFMLQDVIQ